MWLTHAIIFIEQYVAVIDLQGGPLGADIVPGASPQGPDMGSLRLYCAFQLYMSRGEWGRKKSLLTRLVLGPSGEGRGRNFGCRFPQRKSKFILFLEHKPHKSKLDLFFIARLLAALSSVQCMCSRVNVLLVFVICQSVSLVSSKGGPG